MMLNKEICKKCIGRYTKIKGSMDWNDFYLRSEGPIGGCGIDDTFWEMGVVHCPEKSNMLVHGGCHIREFTEEDCRIVAGRCGLDFSEIKFIFGNRNLVINDKISLGCPYRLEHLILQKSEHKSQI